MGRAKKILKGKFPNKTLTLDQQVETVNNACAYILEAYSEGLTDKVDRRVNNLALWLGGIHPDIQVYAFQVLLKGYKIEFEADDKTEARMARLEERIEASRGYIEYHYQNIDHHPWPREYLDGTTFEDRLDALIEEQGFVESPADALLSGTQAPEDLTYDQRFQLARDCVADLLAAYEKYGKATVLTDERADRFFVWLLEIEDEIGMLSVRKLLSQGFTFSKEGVPTLSVMVERWGDTVLKKV